MKSTQLETFYCLYQTNYLKIRSWTQLEFEACFTCLTIWCARNTGIVLQNTNELRLIPRCHLTSSSYKHVKKNFIPKLKVTIKQFNLCKEMSHKTLFDLKVCSLLVSIDTKLKEILLEEGRQLEDSKHLTAFNQHILELL